MDVIDSDDIIKLDYHLTWMTALITTNIPKGSRVSPRARHCEKVHGLDLLWKWK
jgi:hypothetical protein